MLEKGKAHIERGLPMFHSFLFDDADLQFKTAANADVGCLGYHPVLAIVTGTGHLTLCLSALAPMQKAAHEGMTWTVLDERCSDSVGDATPALPTYASYRQATSIPRICCSSASE
jgi:hypothetical protein